MILQRAAAPRRLGQAWRSSLPWFPGRPSRLLKGSEKNRTSNTCSRWAGELKQSAISFKSTFVPPARAPPPCFSPVSEPALPHSLHGCPTLLGPSARPSTRPPEARRDHLSSPVQNLAGGGTNDMREVPLLHLRGPAGGPGEDEQERNPKGPSEEPSGTQVNRAGAGWADLSLQISVRAAWGEEGTGSGLHDQVLRSTAPAI